MNMTITHKERPHCFADLKIVFPEGEEGFRSSPKTCMACEHKTACLKSAMKGREGLKVKEEALDRAYAAGMVGFFERWSKKKAFHQKAADKE